ncbi:hypothetical protein HDU96_006921, partial [Phlyctochytrium bullatum]
MFSANKHSGPALTLRWDPTTRRLLAQTPLPDQRNWTYHQLKDHTLRTLHQAFSSSREPRVHPHRLGYAFLSKVFVVNAPRPIGGKRRPG